MSEKSTHVRRNNEGMNGNPKWERPNTPLVSSRLRFASSKIKATNDCQWGKIWVGAKAKSKMQRLSKITEEETSISLRT